MALSFKIREFSQPEVSRIASRKGVTTEGELGEGSNACEACQEDALDGEIAKRAERSALRRDCRRVSAPRPLPSSLMIHEPPSKAPITPE